MLSSAPKGLTLFVLAVISQSAVASPILETQPGEGVLCLWTYTVASAEIGRRCRSGRNPELQAELERAVERFDAYVLRNAPEATPEMVERFKREQGLSGASTAVICESEITGLYDRIEGLGIAHLRSQVDEMLARPGRPTWGDCP